MRAYVVNTPMIINGDSLEVLKTYPDAHFDSVVTDPPYGLAFMGKKWDYDVPSVELWREVFRVMKPGAHLLSFGGTRTYHRMVVAIEDAGFEIRDQIQWIYGSGFPKSLDVSKAIDKAAGAEREVIGFKSHTSQDTRGNPISETGGRGTGLGQDKERLQLTETAPATPDAKRWQGWGTALKPANEPIVLARKPLEKGLTVAENVLKWGCGALNVDASRIAIDPNDPNSRPNGSKPLAEGGEGSMFKMGGRNYETCNGNTLNLKQGRWPANVLFDEQAASVLDEQVGPLVGAGNKKTGDNFNAPGSKFGIGTDNGPTKLYDRGGSASRFFYVAKASKRERNAGLEGMPAIRSGSLGTGEGGGPMLTGSGNARDGHNQNFHPTVKPVKLMEYLVRMVTPPQGIVLDPFAGSGTTGLAAKNLGFQFIGIEREQAYCDIARKRCEEFEYGDGDMSSPV